MTHFINRKYNCTKYSCVFLTLFCCLFLLNTIEAQWSYEELTPMPEKVANNAVTSIEVDGKWFVYSFAGIDSTKEYTGIHKKCFKYDVAADLWSRLPDLPNGNGRIAAGASVLHNKIYVVGGYQVFQNGSEQSFRLMHVLDPVSDTFLPDAKSLFYSIDDHVQDVWRDSLLYIVTGWSNVSNLKQVQVYDPSTDSWREASSVPDNTNFRVFGGSGVIIGDTIYYAGGASDVGSFPATNHFRKGAINPSDPTKIKWKGQATSSARGYRMAASVVDDKPVWIGGSDNTYNYDGIAYNGSGGVPPLGRAITYNPQVDSFKTFEAIFPPHMDFRGIGKLDDNTFILAGGMGENQEVTNRVFKLKFTDNSNSISIDESVKLEISPNPFLNFVQINSTGQINSVVIYNNMGSEIHRIKNENEIINWAFGNGVFFFDVEFSSGLHVIKKMIRNE